MGYEGLSVDITLSRKFMVPLVQISWQKKAPAFANIDNIEEKLRDHYGEIYTDPALFHAKVVESEKHEARFGAKVGEITTVQGKEYELYKMKANSDERGFKEKQFYLQSMLTWFIDGAS